MSNYTKIETYDGLDFDPHHKHLIEIQASCDGVTVPWDWDERELQIAYDLLIEHGLDIPAAIIAKSKSYRTPRYHEGWAYPHNGSILHYWRHADTRSIIQPICRRTNGTYGYHIWPLPVSDINKRNKHARFCRWCQRTLG